MFNYWKKIDELHHMNRLLLAFSMVLIIIICGCLFALIKAPKRIEFWLTPQMAANGGLMKADMVPDEYVHGFVSALWPTLHTWESSDDFSHHLQAFQYYFTPRHQQLMQQTLTAFEEAQFFTRVQTASLYRFMEPNDIKRLNNNAWEVHILLRITQRLNAENPMLISDKVVDYYLRVVKVATSKLQNPFELALDGYTKPEHLLNDFLNGVINDH